MFKCWGKELVCCGDEEHVCAVYVKSLHNPVRSGWCRLLHVSTADESSSQLPAGKQTGRRQNTLDPVIIDISVMTRDESTGGAGHHHARPLALLLCVEAVPVAAAASVPELGAGVGLLVVVPADVVVPTRALVQD